MHIYLAPHHDDVCFSIGDLAGRMGGALVTAFTVSRYVVAPMDLPADPDARIAAVSDLRMQEDMRFADAAGLSRHDLGLLDAPLLGYGPFDISGLEEETHRLSAKLIPCLLDLLAGEAGSHNSAIYCPIGIGAHRNHLSLLHAVRGAHETLAQRCDIFLYEDLHYASNAGLRRSGLAYAAKLFAGLDMSPDIMALDAPAARRKLDWINLYASQHAQPPHLRNFSPASGLSRGPHEIAWRISRRQTSLLDSAASPARSKR